MKLSEREEVTRAGKNYKMRSIKTWKAPRLNRALNSSWSRWELHTVRAKILQNSNTLSCKENLKERFGGRRYVEWVPWDEAKLLWIREWNFWFYIKKAKNCFTTAGTVSSSSSAPISETVSINVDDITIYYMTLDPRKLNEFWDWTFRNRMKKRAGRVAWMGDRRGV